MPVSGLIDLARFLFERDIRRLIFLACLIYGVALHSLVLPVLFALAVDVLLPNALSAHLVAVVAAALLLAALRFCLAFVQDYEFQRLRQNCERRVIGNVVAGVLKSPQDSRLAGRQARIDDWLRLWLVNFQFQMTEIVYFAAYAVLISLTVMAVIWWVDPRSGFLMLLFAALHYANFRHHNQCAGVHAQDYAMAKTAFVRDVVAALAAKRAVNLARLDDRIVAQIADKAGRAFGAARDQSATSASQALVQSFLRGTLYLLMVCSGAQQIAAGEMTIGGLLLVLMLVSFAYEPVYRLNQITAMANQLLANSAPLRSFLDRDATGPQIERPVSGAGQVVLNDVSPVIHGKPLFKPVSVRLQMGCLYLIRGASGAGKSTLLDIMAGMRSPGAGLITCGDGDIAPSRQSIYHMRQNATLFDGTLVDNISLFAADPDHASIGHLLAHLGLAHLAELFPSQLDPSRLSQGERQRIALARALYSDARLLLLDEPTAHLDHASETLCLAAIRSSCVGRITVLVSHGPLASEVADEIIHLEPARAP